MMSFAGNGLHLNQHVLLVCVICRFACFWRSTHFLLAGQACHAAEPGFFRICYAIVDRDTILQLVERLVNFISKSETERQEVPLWINRASLQKTKQAIKQDPTKPDKPLVE